MKNTKKGVQFRSNSGISSGAKIIKIKCRPKLSLWSKTKTLHGLVESEFWFTEVCPASRNDNLSIKLYKWLTQSRIFSCFLSKRHIFWALADEVQIQMQTGHEPYYDRYWQLGLFCKSFLKKRKQGNPGSVTVSTV